jgi:hypothetical protein
VLERDFILGWPARDRGTACSVSPLAFRHDLTLPDKRVVRGVYYPAALVRGDRVQLDGRPYEVEAALTLAGDLHEAVVRVRLREDPVDEAS